MKYAALKAAELQAAEAIRATAEAEGRQLTEDELGKIEAHIEQAEKYEALAKRESEAKLEGMVAALKAVENAPADSTRILKALEDLIAKRRSDAAP